MILQESVHLIISLLQTGQQALGNLAYTNSLCGVDSFL